VDSTAERLMTELDTCQQRVRQTYTRYFLAPAPETVEKDSLHVRPRGHQAEGKHDY